MNLPIQLVVSDFDGTLIDYQQQLPQANRQAIDRYIDAGGIFAVCTGRMIKSIMPHVRALGLHGLVVGYQGSMIADIQTGEVIRCYHLDVEQAVRICQTLEEKKQIVNVYANETLYTNATPDTPALQKYEQITGVKAICINDQPISSYVQGHRLECQKISSLVKPEDKLPVFELLSQKFGQELDVCYSAAVLVEISPKGNDKGEALQFLANHYQIPIEKTMAIGDNNNDVPMIKVAGIGIAVGNAVDCLKEVATHIVGTNAEAGVAQAINTYGFYHEN